MSLILNIDTALDTASVCLSDGEKTIGLSINENQKDHASWLHTAIVEVLQKNNVDLKQLDAAGVSIGPGSYTGLRVGLAAAKGLCYALHIPLITIGTLEMMAYAVKEEASDLICPLIDARRMEVFAAVYDRSMQEKISPHAIVIDDSSFSSFLVSSPVLFCGTGYKKLQPLLTNPKASFTDTRSNASHLGELTQHRFNKKEFSDLAYTEPLYIKEFYSPPATN